VSLNVNDFTLIIGNNQLNSLY